MDNTELTLEEYLQQWVSGFGLDEGVCKSVALLRGADANAAALDIEEKLRDLCVADLLVRAAMSPDGGSIEDADGEWKHKETRGNSDSSLRSSLLSRANTLYKKWGEQPVTSGARIVSFGLSRRGKYGCF